MQTFHGIGIKIELENLVIDVGKCLQVAFVFFCLPRLIALRNMNSSSPCSLMHFVTQPNIWARVPSQRSSVISPATGVSAE